MIVHLANKTRFREKPHGKGAQASCLFLEDEQATDPKATGRMPMLLSNLFIGSGAFTATPSNTFQGLIVDEAHRLNEKSSPKVEARTTAMNHLEPIPSFSA